VGIRQILERPSVVFGLRAGAIGLAVAAVGYFGAGAPLQADAPTYLAAGERLNAGHALYTLVPGDRFIDWKGSPLVYPPLIAVVWRPLALGGESVLGPWILVTTMAVVAAFAYAVWRAPLLAFLLAMPAAYDLSHGNVNGLLACAMMASLRARPPIAGSLLALAAAVKILPGLLVLVLIREQRWSALGWTLAVGAGLLGASILGAGWDAHVAYLTSARASLHLNTLVMLLGITPLLARAGPTIPKPRAAGRTWLTAPRPA
jgi:hypothetical protein